MRLPASLNVSGEAVQNGARLVSRSIVDDDDLERGIVEAEKRGDGRFDSASFIARGHDDGDWRTGRRWRHVGQEPHPLLACQEINANGGENDRRLGQNRPAEASWTRGVIALVGGQAREAEADLRQASETHTCPICSLPDLARAYEAVGKPEAALITYERYASTPWLWRYEIDANELGFALIRIGELYAAKGDAEKGGQAYARLTRLWERGDPDIQSLLIDARKKVAPAVHVPRG